MIPLLMAMLPQGISQDRVNALENYSGTPMQFIRQWAALLLQGYSQQALRALTAFGKYANIGLAAVVLFSFAAAPEWPGTFTALIVVLLAFIIRDAYIHERQPFRTDGITDAAIALVFLLADEVFTLQWLPALAMPKPVFFRGAVACLPLLAMVRMLSRPMPQPDRDTLWPGMPPERIYWRMMRLNVLWLFMFYFSIDMFVYDGPSRIDYVRGFLPSASFATWIMLQTNRLVRRNFIQPIFTDPQRLKLSRMIETLPQGMKKGDPLYWWYVALEGLIFFMGTANIGVELWNWLYGDSQASWWRISTSLIAFVVVVVAWKYVKAANRAAVATIRAAMSAGKPPYRL